MRTSSVVALLTMAIVVSGCGKETVEPGPGKAPAKGSSKAGTNADADFLAAFKSAVKAKDITAAMASSAPTLDVLIVFLPLIPVT